MKKTTYIILGLLISNFVLITAFFVLLRSSKHQKPIYDSSFDEGSIEVIETIEPEPADYPVTDMIVIQYNGRSYYYQFSGSGDAKEEISNRDLQLILTDSLTQTIYIEAK